MGIALSYISGALGSSLIMLRLDLDKLFKSYMVANIHFSFKILLFNITLCYQK